MRVPDDRYEPITVDEAASRLKVSPSTVRRMIRDGKLQAEREQRPQGEIVRVLWPAPTDVPMAAAPSSEPSLTQAPDASQDVALALVDRLAAQDAMIAESAERERAQADRIAALERENGRLESEATHALQIAEIERERRLEADKRAARAEALASERAAEMERLLRRPWWRRILDG